MSGSNRGIVFASVAGLIILAAVLGYGAASLYHAEQQQHDTITANSKGQNGNRQPEQYLFPRAGIPASVESRISNPQPATGQDHEKRDLAAQEASAAFAWWMVVVSALGFIVTTAGTILLYQQIRLTSDAVKDTGDATRAMVEQNQLTEKTLRAYMSVEHPQAMELTLGQPLKIQAKIGNFGQTPAHNTEIDIHLVVSDCKTGETKFSKRHPTGIPHVVGPGQCTLTMTTGPELSADMFQKLAEAVYRVDLIINFTYRDIFGKKYGVRSSYNYAAPRFRDRISSLNCVAYEEYTPEDAEN